MYVCRLMTECGVLAKIGKLRCSDRESVPSFCVCIAHIVLGEATPPSYRNRREEYVLRSAAVLLNHVFSTDVEAITKARLAQTSCIVNQLFMLKNAKPQMVIHRRTCMWPISSG